MGIICSKKETMVLNDHNYGTWAQDMDTMFKSKVLYQFTMTTILYLKDEY
jgi:hypothetical protein